MSFQRSAASLCTFSALVILSIINPLVFNNNNNIIKCIKYFPVASWQSNQSRQV